jgi:hypothetical protein
MNGYLMAIGDENGDAVPLGVFPTFEAAREWAATAGPDDAFERMRAGIEWWRPRVTCDEPGTRVVPLEGARHAGRVLLGEELTDRLWGRIEAGGERWRLRCEAKHDQHRAEMRDLERQRDELQRSTDELRRQIEERQREIEERRRQLDERAGEGHAREERDG